MAKNKIGLELKGFEELITKLDGLEGNVKGAVEDCLKVSQEIVAEELDNAMKKHNRTGSTKEAIRKNGKVEWEGMTAGIGVGFEFPEGLPSVFLMYGTPRMKKDSKVYAAVYGKKIKEKIARMQSLILQDEIHNAMNKR